MFEIYCGFCYARICIHIIVTCLMFTSMFTYEFELVHLTYNKQTTQSVETQIHNFLLFHQMLNASS